MLTGVILAGGENRRMNGKIKALLPFHGEPLIVRQIHRMKSICDSLIIVTRYPDRLHDVLGDGVCLMKDRIPGKGPLSGIHAALSVIKGADAWVVACDMPFVSAPAARLLWERKQASGCEAVVPVIDNRLHPLHGVYDQKCLQASTDLLRTGDYSLKGMLQRLQLETMAESAFERRGIKLRFVMNVNTPEAYQDAKKV